MNITVTLNMLPDLLASSALLTLAIYTFMVFWGRRNEVDEIYNLYFSLFVFSAALFIIAPYFQSQYFLNAYKPAFLNVINIEMFSILCLFFSGMQFLNYLLNVSAKIKKYSYYLMATLSINLIATFSSNFFGVPFYYKYILTPLLLLVVINVLVIFAIYGRWILKEKLFRNNFVRIIFFGFILLTSNILIYRTIELLSIPRILILNHYFTALMLYIFAYALSVKFNKEHVELKLLKVSLEQKVNERTLELKGANQILEKRNAEIEDQKREIITINEALKERAEELKELDLMKSHFFANISHEFRTPLTLIIGPLEALLAKAGSTHNTYEYKLMLKQAKRLLELINQLLELSKLQKNMLKLRVSPGNINDFVRTLVEAYSSFAKELNIKLSFTDELQNQSILFDKDKLEKIINNLITNALKFTESSGEVTVTLKKSDSNGHINIIVKDTGIGMGEILLLHIFDPFFSANNNKFEGTGIGLALVKELVQVHYGEVQVKSEFGLGSEFIVSIPSQNEIYSLDEIEAEAPVIEQQSINIFSEVPEIKNPMIGDRQKPLILLVDDNTDMRKFISANLINNFQIIEAINGKEGLECALKNVPDLIISDVMMPVMNGLEFTKAIKTTEITSHIPIILLTAKASTNSRIEGFDSQADDYLTKPFNMYELTMRVRNLISTRITLQEKYSRKLEISPREIEASSMDERFLQKALSMVENHMDDPGLNMEKFCQGLNMSRTQVHRKLRALTGQSATEFIRTIRLKRAGQLLVKKSGAVSEIAYQTGFNNLSYFTKTFKEQFGMSPSEYKN